MNSTLQSFSLGGLHVWRKYLFQVTMLTSNSLICTFVHNINKCKYLYSNNLPKTTSIQILSSGIYIELKLNI